MRSCVLWYAVLTCVLARQDPLSHRQEPQRGRGGERERTEREGGGRERVCERECVREREDREKECEREGHRDEPAGGVVVCDSIRIAPLLAEIQKVHYIPLPYFKILHPEP